MNMKNIIFLLYSLLRKPTERFFFFFEPTGKQLKCFLII